MKKLPILLFGAGILVFSCTRRFECNCDYKQRSFELNDDLDTIEVRKDEKYFSYINFTSKKLANEECDERGRSLMLDSLKIEASCGVVKYKP